MSGMGTSDIFVEASQSARLAKMVKYVEPWQDFLALLLWEISDTKAGSSSVPVFPRESSFLFFLFRNG
jgi:hypothetical protein